MLRRLGLVGIGKIAQHHALAAQALGASIVSACARRPASPNWSDFLAVAPECNRLDDPTSVASDPSVDAVIVCADWDSMNDLASEMLRFKKPLLLEKPVALNVEEAVKLAEQCKGRTDVFVGYNRRFYEPISALRQQILNQKLIGVSVRICETVRRQRERFGAELIAHLMPFSCAHSLDTLLYLLGPLSVDRVRHYSHTGDLAPFTSHSGLLATQDGIPVTFELLGEDPGPSEMRFRFADESVWVLSPLERVCVYKGSTVTEPDEQSRVRRYTPNQIKTIDAEASHKPGMLGQMREFLSGDRNVAANLDEAVQVMQLIEKIATR